MTRMLAQMLMIAAALAALTLSTGCGGPLIDNALDPENAPQAGEGWISLFDGESLEGWHKRADHKGEYLWCVEDGLLTNKLEHGQHGSDIVTEKTFRDFELYYEYKVPKDSNSGMYLRGLYEIQIRGDAGKSGDQGTDGGIWATSVPSVNASKAPGEWQSVYVKLVGQTIEKVIFNGQLTHENVNLPKPTGGNLDLPMDAPGPIMIQGDHGAVQLRNIYIKPLESCCGTCKAK